MPTSGGHQDHMYHDMPLTRVASVTGDRQCENRSQHANCVPGQRHLTCDLPMPSS